MQRSSLPARRPGAVLGQPRAKPRVPLDDRVGAILRIRSPQRIGSSADQSSHCSCARCALLRGPVSHETGQFMSDYRIVIGCRKRRPVFHVELTDCEDGKAAQAILLGARQSARRPTGNRRETAFIIARASRGGVELTISRRPPSRRREGSSILDGARSPSGGHRPGGPSRRRPSTA